MHGKRKRVKYPLHRMVIFKRLPLLQIYITDFFMLSHQKNNFFWFFLLFATKSKRQTSKDKDRMLSGNFLSNAQRDSYLKWMDFLLALTLWQKSHALIQSSGVLTKSVMNSTLDSGNKLRNWVFVKEPMLMLPFGFPPACTILLYSHFPYLKGIPFVLLGIGF